MITFDNIPNVEKTTYFFYPVLSSRYLYVCLDATKRNDYAIYDRKDFSEVIPPEIEIPETVDLWLDEENNRPVKEMRVFISHMNENELLKTFRKIIECEDPDLKKKQDSIIGLSSMYPDSVLRNESYEGKILR